MYSRSDSARVCRCLALLLAFAAGVASAQERFVRKLALAPGLVVVVAEGDLEARSIGSYAVRVYADPGGTPGNDTAFYAAGLVHPRDGTVRSIGTIEMSGRTPPLLAVVVQSAGSGGYLSAAAFSVGSGAVRFVAGVEGLAPSADPVLALRGKLSDGGR